MGLFGLGKSGKLKIKAFKKQDRLEKPFGTFEAMFNPDSFSQTYTIQYSKAQGLDSTKGPLKYTYGRPSQLKLKLILDDTGVLDMGIVSLFGSKKSVSDRVKEFIDLTFNMNGDTHEPSYLIAEWGGKDDGGLNFSCRLASVDVSYVSFNSEGLPLRAELNIELISDEEIEKRVSKEGKNSPDLTHSRIVKSGDTLPLLCKEIYGSSQYYMRVAQANNLDNFRNLRPGQEIVFPPLGKAR